ncbi:DUF4192 domain-containing protein [Kitasatospora sp. NPDC058218]|uniref:DUF4192 domain-containing protein n=1 Tax=Kitasatospora sp. NPDC058218 TaxID=3346385 RepID=UPI0036DA3470
MNNERIAPPFGPASAGRPVTMRGPADMAELLPYLLGFFPDDSIVAVGLQGPDLHQGGVIRLDIPESPKRWPAAADETASLLVGLSERRDRRPVQVLLYLCQDPDREHGPPVLDRLGPLAGELRAAFEARGVAVKESLCVSSGRWWSFLCRREGCCDPAGHPVRHSPGPGPVAAAATFAGLAPRGSRKALVAGLAPIGPPGADAQRLALARAVAVADERAGHAPPPSREQGGALLDQAVAEFMAGSRALDEDRAARLLIALQDRRIRDQAAEYVRPEELAPTQRLWRFLARRCVPPYTGYAPPPLTLLAWASWVAGDTATARVVLAHTLRLAPSYLLAQLLYESLNGGLAPEELLASVVAERSRRSSEARGEPADSFDDAPDRGSGSDRGSGPGSDPEEPSGPAPAKPRRRRARKGSAEADAPKVSDVAGPAAAADAAGPAGRLPDRPAGATPKSGEAARPDDGPSGGPPLPRTSDRGAGRPSARVRSVRRLRLGRASPWASAEATEGGRSRCRGARASAGRSRHAR